MCTGHRLSASSTAASPACGNEPTVSTADLAGIRDLAHSPDLAELAEVTSPEEVWNLAELAEIARRRLDPVHRDFFAGGAGDERTLRANESAFDAYRILPRVLRGVRERDLRTRLLGATISMPVVVAPTAFHRLAHPNGESGTARAVAAAGTILVVSVAATTPIEAIAAAAATGAGGVGGAAGAGGTGDARGAGGAGGAAGVGGGPPPLWFQLYPEPDLGFVESLVRRVETAGCQALVVTVDSPVLGRRERDLRNGFLDLPPGLVCENMRDPATGAVRNITLDGGADWSWIGWLREITHLPILLKGVLHPADARLAAEHGVDGVYVSNHGGRQLDGAPATIEALSAVVDAIDGRMPILFDGGIRRGSDVLTALALGADAVAVGRPILWGLAAFGEAGVRRALELLRADLDRAMAFVGAAGPADLTPDLITPGVRR